MDNRPATLLLAILVTACTHGNVREMPVGNVDVPPVKVNLSERCEGVSGLYANVGVALRAQVVQNPRLAHSLFRLALLSKDGYPLQPRSVKLSVDPAAMALRVTVIGDGAVREWSTRYECENGWVRVRDYQGKQYLGDGVTQKWFRADVFLATDDGRNLVAHVIGEGEDQVFMGGRRRAGGEDWYLFKRQTAD